MPNTLNRRQKDILRLLLYSKEAINSLKIASYVGCSERTIRNDLKSINEILNTIENCLIENIPRNGIVLHCPRDKRNILKNLFGNSLVVQSNNLYLDNDILSLLLFKTRNPLTIQQISDKLFISRPTAYNLLNEAEKILCKYNIKLHKGGHSGIKLVYEEVDFRKMSKHVFHMQKHLMREKKYNKIELLSSELMQYFFTNIPIKKIVKILLLFEEKFEIKLTDNSFENLLFYLALSILRQEQNNIVSDKLIKNDVTVTGRKNYEMSEWIFKRICDEFKLDFNNAEVNFLAYFVISKFHYLRSNDSFKNASVEIMDFSDNLISHMSNIFSIDLTKDQELSNDLVHHFEDALDRFKDGIHCINPYLDEIKNNYPDVYAASWSASMMFDSKFDLSVNSDEIGYIAMHFGAAIERLHSQVKILMVWSSSTRGGVLRHASSKIQDNISGVRIVDIIPLHQLETYSSFDYDIILSDSDNISVVKPYVIVNSIINYIDINNIDNLIKKIRKNNKSLSQNKLNIIDELIKPENAFININCKTKEDIVHFLCDHLLNSGNIDEHYYSSVMERENLTSTSIGGGITTPHGTQKHVKNSTISLATLPEPINWGDEKIDFVILLAINISDLKRKNIDIDNLYLLFVKITQNEDVLKKVKNISKSTDLIDYFKELLAEKQSAT
jgi:activator of the mannose operon, transcriptional antiterminator